ncbi:MAG: Nif3-like dinuclear metal center hexameric protein [Planctomycetota bacterium]
MRTSGIAQLLDREFRIEATADPEMTKHALTESGRAHLLPAFLDRKTGLMFDFGDSVNMTYCVTFTTGEAHAKILKTADGPGLIFTHHPFDYHEDHRGFSATDDRLILKLKKRHISMYAIHAPLDVGRNISVSKSLAKQIGLLHPTSFFPACGGHLGVFGGMRADSLQTMAKTVGRCLGLGTVDVFDNGGKVGLTAVVAGGGDQINILKAAIKCGCTTYVTGTAVARWSRDVIREGNLEFHNLAREARVNLIGATHYNTEKWAVQDVARFLKQHGVPARFVEDPVLSIYEEGNLKLESGQQRLADDAAGGTGEV